MARFHHVFDQRDSARGVAFGDVQDLPGISHYERIPRVGYGQQVEELNRGPIALENDAGDELVPLSSVYGHEMILL